MYIELIPFEIIEETFNKAEIKRLHNLEKENSKQEEEKLKNLEGRGTNSINIIDRIKSLETQNNDEYSNELKRVIQSLLPN